MKNYEEFSRILQEPDFKEKPMQWVNGVYFGSKFLAFLPPKTVRKNVYPIGNFLLNTMASVSTTYLDRKSVKIGFSEFLRHDFISRSTLREFRFFIEIFPPNTIVPVPTTHDEWKCTKIRIANSSFVAPTKYFHFRKTI